MAAGDTFRTSTPIITPLEAVVAITLAWLLFGEQLRPTGLAGALLFFGAIDLLYHGGSPTVT